jgi:CMP-N-acetylneuraminic acid synthetase
MIQKPTDKGIIALLPMKGHSERVPNKNIRPFADQPLFHWIAETLEACACIESIVIDTDSESIAEDARKHFSKVQIIMRPKDLQGDFIPMNDIIGYDLKVTDGEHYLQTHSTNPLLTTGTVEAAINKYFKLLGDYDSLFSVTRLQTRLYSDLGEPLNHNPAELLRTQDLHPIFEENSNFYIFSKQSFYSAGNNRIGLKPKMVEIDKIEAMDIDEEVDFLLSEFIYKYLHNESHVNES